MVLWVCVAGVVLAGVAVIARHRAATAADMSALAAASVIARSGFAHSGFAHSEGAGDVRAVLNGCAAAKAIALANNAMLTSCQAVGQGVDVTARVEIPALRWLGDLGLDAVSSRARAGPG
jgi:hypothetical protein